MRVTFEPVKYSTAKTVACVNCGKSVRRQRTFEMTINPWNVNGAGEPATRAEIVEKLRVKAADWRETPEYCRDCKPEPSFR